MRIEPLTVNIGAAIHDVDLTDCSDSTFDELYQALIKYQVLFFRDQELTFDHHVDFASRLGDPRLKHPAFGEVPGYPTLNRLETKKGRPVGKDFWHADRSWQQIPSRFTMLYCQNVPEYGGDTLWASTKAASAKLPKGLLDKIRPLTSVHAMRAFDKSRYSKVLEDGRTLEQTLNAMPPVEHPVVIRHPDTGEEIVYLNEEFAYYICGLSALDSHNTIEEVLSFCTMPEFQVRFRWKPKSVAIWDNFSTIHRAVADWGDSHRRFFQVTIKKEALVPAMDMQKELVLAA